MVSEAEARIIALLEQVVSLLEEREGPSSLVELRPALSPDRKERRRAS